MNILFFSPYYFPYTSGITTYPQKLLRHLAKSHSVTVLTFRHDHHLAEEEIKDGYQIKRLPYLFKISKGFISPQSLLSFWQELKKTDVVLLNIPNFEGFPLALLATFMRKRVIAIFHCIVFLDNNIFSKLIEFCLNISLWLQLSCSTLIVGYTRDYVDHTWVGKLFKKKIQIVLPPIEYIPSGSENGKNIEKKGLTIGYAGRVAREKGLEYLVEAIQLLNLTEKKNVQLLLAGPYGKQVAGEEEYYNHIVELLKKSKIPYQFLGDLSAGELTKFYRSIDMLVLPSVNSTEAFGMVQAEAMLCGTPVITTNLPGVRVPIQLTKMGLIIEPKDPKALAEAIKTISTNQQTFTNDELTEKARQRFDTEKTYQFYDRILT